MEKYHLPFWNPYGFRLWKWKVIRQWHIQRFLLTIRDQEPLLLSHSSQRTSWGDKPILAQGDQDSARGGKGYMVGRTTRCPVGISDDGSHTYRGDTFSPHIRLLSHPPSGQRTSWSYKPILAQALEEILPVVDECNLFYLFLLLFMLKLDIKDVKFFFFFFIFLLLRLEWIIRNILLLYTIQWIP